MEPLSSPEKLAYSKRYYAEHREMIRRQQTREKHSSAGADANLLACCGIWQPITTLPHVCKTCGQIYFQEG